jgi:hypothetical protein
VRFDGTTGKLIQKSTAGVTDAGFLTANGLTFPSVQVSSADANTLDDYEEGTWTPVFTSLDILNGDITLTYATLPNTGLYRKIGAVVYVSFVINTNSLTVTGPTSSELYIEGLPYIPISGFPLSSSITSVGFANGWTTNAPSFGYFASSAVIGSTGGISLNYKTAPNALTSSLITGANLSSSTSLRASGFYFTAT